jgi:nucleoid-associated protein
MTIGTLRISLDVVAIESFTLNYSRIYQFTPSGTAGSPTFNSALSGSNGDDAHHYLFDSLRSVFHAHSRRQFGVFDAELPNTALAVGIRDYHSQIIDAEKLGLRLAEQIKQGVEGSDQQHPWYLWFIVEQNGAEQFIYLFLLKQDESYQIAAQQTVTIGGAVRPDRLQYAVKINLNEWVAQSKTYLMYLAPKNQSPIMLIWKSLAGFAEGVDRAAQTEVLLTAIDRYADELPAEKEHDYRERVVEYCLDQDRIGAPVEIKALSRHVDEEAPAALMNFLTTHGEEPATELYTDRKQLKRYTRLYGRDNDLSIGFSTLTLGRNIIYDENTETLTIRAIPKSLKSQLARYVKKS